MAELDFEMINRVGRTFKPTDSSTIWTPRPPVWTLQQGGIVGTDINNNVAHVQLNGGGIAEGVRFVQHYTDDIPPTVGDNAWYWYNGKIALLVGRQVIPPGVVTF